MHDDLKLETRGKVLQKMSRDGAVEENVSRGTTKSVSGRIAEITFEKEAAPGSDLEWGRGAKASGGEKKGARRIGYGTYNKMQEIVNTQAEYISVEAAPARNTEAYLDSLLAKVGVETSSAKAAYSIESDMPARQPFITYDAPVNVLDSADENDTYETLLEDMDVDNPETMLYEHRSSLSMERDSAAESKISEKAAYKSRVKKEAVRREAAKQSVERKPVENNPGTLRFDDEIRRSDRLATSDTGPHVVTSFNADARGNKIHNTPTSKEIIKKKLKNKQQRELITYGGVATKVSDTAGEAIHQKIHEDNDDDNSSVEAAHETEIIAENAVRSAGNHLKHQEPKRKSRLKFDDAKEDAINAAETKAEIKISSGQSVKESAVSASAKSKLSEKSAISGAYKESAEKEGAASKTAKNTDSKKPDAIKKSETTKKADAKKKIQKNKIKQSYAEAFREKSGGMTSSKLVDGTKDAVKGGIEKVGEVIVDFVKRNYGAVIALACIGVLFLIILAGSGTVATMISEAGSSFVESTYSSTDDDILNNDESYVEMEDELQDQIDNIESTYSGYDEYRYQVDEISHDPYALASYFTAKYGNFKADDVESELLPLFQEQYTLTLTEEIEIRTRTVTDPDTGEESEEEYEWYVLNVKLENKGVDAIARANLTDKQLMLYNAYQATKGNRSYLFGEHPIAGNVSGGGLSYDIPPEALEDEAFARMIEEAENYLGREYVWGGSSPSTGFDCSGFVSWVINHSGNGWNVGRQTANGLMNHCTYVSSADAKPGDLIFFEKTYNTTGASHVGIYVGDGMMIHCGNPIQYTSIESNYWRQHFLSFGRIN